MNMTDIAAAEECLDCQALKGGGRSTPPHPNLRRERHISVSSPMGPADEDHYSCRVCGKTWLHETGSMGFGWIE